MKLLLFSFCLFVVAGSTGQTIRRSLAAPYIGLGAYSLNHTDAFSFTSNQASLAQLKNASAGVYAERRFMLNELASYNGATVLPTRSGNFGLKAGYSGFIDYNETQLGLAYARSLGSKVDAGVQFNYNGVRISGYGSAAAISFEAGTVFHITEKLHTGFHVNNPVGGKFGKEQQEKLPSVYTAGFGYEASEKFYFGAELIKEENQEVNVDAGLQYQFIPLLLARAGVSSSTSSVWFGLGFSFKSLRLDVTSSYHPQLGISPGLMLLFNFKPQSPGKNN
ncbi:MAG TPA: hypothetical protein VI461_08215 [Chitinophagaceae bacterium]|nr:hypothetical protein [Chitinophagaceae bacterium]